MISLKVLAYEHLSGGGFVDQKIPINILCEGFGMLRYLISDFRRAGHYVITLLDSRIAALNPLLQADKVVTIPSLEVMKRALMKSCEEADAVYILAPESNGTLQRLVENVEALGKTSLNCRVDAMEIVSNKAISYEALKRARLRLPETLIMNVNNGIERIKGAVKSIGLPVVFKPARGIGCQGLSVITNEAQVKDAIDKIKRESMSESFLIQERVFGTAVSVSVISTDKGAMSITLNRQMIVLRPPRLNSGYIGGIVPFHHPLKEKAMEAARRAVEAIKGLRGYVGVDMVLTRKEPFVMEINPRLTTSYVGLTKVVNFNPAQAIMDAVIEDELPEKVRTSGYAFFSKVRVKSPSYNKLLKIYELDYIVSPPFSIEDEKFSYALLAFKAEELKEAIIGFNNALKNLNQMLDGDRI